MNALTLIQISRAQQDHPSGFAHLYEHEAARDELKEMRDAGLIVMTLGVRGISICKLTALGVRVLAELRATAS